MEETTKSHNQDPYVTLFTEYQRKMWYTLSQGAVTRFYHTREWGQNGYTYLIKKIGPIALTFYWLTWINSIIKMGYLLLTYNEWFGIEVHFLDQMSMWDWYLIGIQMVQEQSMWYPKYPMYENLHRQWTIQEDIFRKLGRPSHIAEKIHRTDFINTFYYPSVVFTGIFALSVQFFFTPKYALNTYALVPPSFDPLWLQVIFCIHECLFMYHGYAYQATTMVVAESMSTSYQHLLEEMTKTVYKLIEVGKPEQEDEFLLNKSFETPTTENEKDKPKRVKKSAYRRQMMSGESGVASGVYRRRPIRRHLEPLQKAPGTEYDIMTLINDYRKIIICSNEHNKWIGRLMGGAQAANYAQFVSDVFIMIQLLQEPDFDLFGVSFYIMDACFGMCMLFRMLILLSRLVPASDEFVHSVKCYAMYQTPIRKYIVKVLPTMRRVSAKLRGYSVRPQSVPVGVNILINWYICAAMWKRPDDPNRRT